MDSKNQQVRDFIERQVKESISVYVSQLSDRPAAEIINQQLDYGRATGAVRRASLDATRALAEMRKP